MARLSDPTSSLDEPGQSVWNELLERRARRGARLPGVYLPLMHNPRLAKQVEQLGDHLRFEGVLARDIYEFVVLAVGARIGAAYEWAHHESLARDAGVPIEAIAALATRTDPPRPYVTILRAVEVFGAHDPLPVELQDQIIDLVGTDGLVELAILVGTYAMVGGVINGFGVVSADDRMVQ